VNDDARVNLDVVTAAVVDDYAERRLDARIGFAAMHEDVVTVRQAVEEEATARATSPAIVLAEHLHRQYIALAARGRFDQAVPAVHELETWLTHPNPTERAIAERLVFRVWMLIRAIEEFDGASASTSVH